MNSLTSSGMYLHSSSRSSVQLLIHNAPGSSGRIYPHSLMNVAWTGPSRTQRRHEIEAMEDTSSMGHSISNLLIPCSLELAGGERERQENE
jgi:hypothetical protein